MINLFLINEDEKNRILNLHKDATKRQYLKEQTSTYGSSISVNLYNLTLTFNNYLQMENNKELRIDRRFLLINKGTIFGKENNNTLVTTQKVDYRLTKLTGWFGSEETSHNGLIKYYCDNKSFAVEGNTEKFSKGRRWPEDFQKGFDDLCNKIKTDKIDLGNAELGSESLFRKNYPCVVNHPNAKKVQIRGYGEIYLINDNYYYSNGSKYIPKGNKTVKYTCNDPEFKTSKSSTNKVYTPRPSDDVLDNYLNS